jgi:parallel beta-helix repeat protein
VIFITFFGWRDILEVSQINSHPPNFSKAKFQSLTPHGPISIHSNEDFVVQGFPGSGTSNDPYVIEGLNISKSNYIEDLIAIMWTTAHFVVKNNYINGLSTAWGGIILTDVENGKIVNNTITHVTSQAMAFYQSQNNIIANNTISFNPDAIRLENSADNNVITYNKIFYCDNGIIIEAVSCNSTIAFNQISNCGLSALVIFERSDNHTIKSNTFLANQRISGSQAFDSGSYNSFSYNHWDEWTSPDLNKDGIVDVPYQISGYQNNMDQFPLVEPIQNFQFNFSSSTKLDNKHYSFPIDLRFLIAVLILLVLMGLLVVSIRKQSSIDQ